MRLLLCILILCPSFYAQESIPPKDSIELAFHQKSMLYSAIVPGAGQVRNSIASPLHNHAIWKVPLIYAGLGATGYFLVTNQQMQLSLKQEYTNRLEGGVLNPKWAAYDNYAVLQLYRQYLDWRDLSILGMAAVYLFQVAEAGAEAHFVQFETSPDLSLSLDPVLFPNQTFGLKLQLSFH